MLEGAFPRALPEADFQECMSAVLIDNGFNPDNSINLVATCRDELCRPFTDGLDSVRPATPLHFSHASPHAQLEMRCKGWTCLGMRRHPSCTQHSSSYM